MGLGAVALGAAGCLWGACTYDFDAAFSETPTGSAAGSGGQAGTPSGGGSGLTGNQGGGGGSATGGSGGAAGERCTNGADDDGDELVDCADPDCSAFACAPTPPANWEGPIAFGLVPGADPLPTCPAGWPTSSTAVDDLVSAPAQCAPCACTDATITCSLPLLHSYTASGCATEEASFPPSGNGVCTPFDVMDMDSLRSGPSQLTTEQDCTPTGGEPLAVEPVWSVHARLCLGSPLGTGCDAGSACVPGPTVSFALCITRPGDEVCPPGYPDKTLLYAGFEDNRTCSSCSCNGWPSCSSAHTDVWTATTDCSGEVDETLPASTVCRTTMMNEVTGSFMFVAPATFACTPAGGSGQGSVAPIEPITVCCAS